MTADTETIREALEEMCPYLERKVASFPDDGFARLRFERAAAALAALGRVEAREAGLAGALEEACDWLDVDLAHAPNTATSMADRELVARWRAALSSAAGSGEE